MHKWVISSGRSIQVESSVLSRHIARRRARVEETDAKSEQEQMSPDLKQKTQPDGHETFCQYGSRRRSREMEERERD